MKYPRLFMSFFAALAGCASIQDPDAARQSSLTLLDDTRQREIPIELYFPPQTHRCTSAQPCPVAFISSGYGVDHTEYSFIAATVNELGYLAVGIQHELPADPPLATEGDLFALRAPN